MHIHDRKMLLLNVNQTVQQRSYFNSTKGYYGPEPIPLWCYVKVKGKQFGSERRADNFVEGVEGISDESVRLKWSPIGH